MERESVKDIKKDLRISWIQIGKTSRIYGISPNASFTLYKLCCHTKYQHMIGNTNPVKLAAVPEK